MKIWPIVNDPAAVEMDARLIPPHQGDIIPHPEH
jgi:hypothetical protein